MVYVVEIKDKNQAKSIFENCKDIWKSDDTIYSKIDFLINHYCKNNDFPLNLKYNTLVNKLSFESVEDKNLKVLKTFKNSDEFLNYLNLN